MSWPAEYAFPKQKLSAETMAAIDSKDDLRKPSQRHQRGLIIGAIVSDVMENYTLYPDTEQKDMARALITAFPHLREENSVGGHAAWLASIIDALKNKRRDLKCVSEVALRSVKRKEPAHSDKAATCTKLKKPETLEESALPVEELEEASCIEDMKRIMKHVERDRDIVKLKALMKRTYTARRATINNAASIAHLCELYPALFTTDCLADEFEEICQKSNTLKSAKHKLDLIADSIVRMARKSLKRHIKSTPVLAKLIEEYDELSTMSAHTDTAMDYKLRVLALLLLPIHLAEDPNLLCRQYGVSLAWFYV